MDDLHCSGCSKPIGHGTEHNPVFFCDEAIDDAWCAACFAHTPCGLGEHDEGCETVCFYGHDHSAED